MAFALEAVEELIEKMAFALEKCAAAEGGVYLLDKRESLSNILSRSKDFYFKEIDGLELQEGNIKHRPRIVIE
ncbi:hypothetical protein YC2023_055804 [Brassica napus]